MATHIDYPTNTIGGKLLAEATATAILARQQFQRLKALADSVCSGGGQPALLESDPTFAFVTDTGSDLYTHIADQTAGLNGLTSLADIDMGS